MARSRATDRILREIRLLWLLGHGTPEIARRVGRHRSTVWKYIREHSLDSPEAPLERADLTLDVLLDRQADAALVEGSDGAEARADAGVILRIISEKRRLTHAIRTIEGQDEADEEEDEAEDDFSVAAARRWLEMDASGGAGETKAREAGGAADGRRSLPCPPEPVAGGRPRYTGAAAGRLADMSVHGRTRRWQDTGGGGMAALVPAARGLPAGGAGWAGPP